MHLAIPLYFFLVTLSECSNTRKIVAILPTVSFLIFFLLFFLIGGDLLYIWQVFLLGNAVGNSFSQLKDEYILGCASILVVVFYSVLMIFAFDLTKMIKFAWLLQNVTVLFGCFMLRFSFCFHFLFLFLSGLFLLQLVWCFFIWIIDNWWF